MTADRYEVRAARRAEARDALELLLADCAPADRVLVAADLARQLPGRGDDCPGLYVACEQRAVVGGGWGQLHRGRTGSVWRPRFWGDDVAPLGAELVRRSAEWLATHDLCLMQSLLAPHDATAARWLTECGFAHVARLGYLVWSDDQRPLPEVSLRFTAASAAEAGELARIVERSYHGTLDCPELNGLRTMTEVLDGYGEVGAAWPEAWLVAWRADVPIGCLILADHPASQQSELVYMGLVPEFRGQALGVQLVSRAKRLLRERGRSRLVLAVDLRNAPALQLYHRQGFTLWDERDVFISAVGDSIVATKS